MSTLPAERPAADRGLLTIAPSVVAKVAARAALDVEHLERSTATPLARLLRRNPTGLPDAQAEVGAESARLEMTITLRYPAGAWTTAEKVRERVTERVRTLTGLEVREIDITVAEFVKPPARPRVK